MYPGDVASLMAYCAPAIATITLINNECLFRGVGRVKKSVRPGGGATTPIVPGRVREGGHLSRPARVVSYPDPDSHSSGCHFSRSGDVIHPLL